MEILEINEYAFKQLLNRGYCFAPINNDFNPNLHESFIVFFENGNQASFEILEMLVDVTEIVLSAAFGNDDDCIGICVLAASNKTIDDCLDDIARLRWYRALYAARQAQNKGKQPHI